VREREVDDFVVRRDQLHFESKVVKAKEIQKKKQRSEKKKKKTNHIHHP
jgi:hypothetical protein